LQRPLHAGIWTAWGWKVGCARQHESWPGASTLTPAFLAALKADLIGPPLSRSPLPRPVKSWRRQCWVLSADWRPDPTIGRRQRWVTLHCSIVLPPPSLASRQASGSATQKAGQRAGQADRCFRLGASPGLPRSGSRHTRGNGCNPPRPCTRGSSAHTCKGPGRSMGGQLSRR